MTKYIIIFSDGINSIKVKDSNDKYLFDTFEEAYNLMMDEIYMKN